MRGPRTILIATIVVTTGVSATILRAQQMRAGSAQIAASAVGAIPSPGDPSLAGRTSRQLLRNGLDYLDTYGDHERALVFLTEAGNRPADLDDAERNQLRQGLARAQKAAQAATVASDSSAIPISPASSPRTRGRVVAQSAPGQLVLAPAPASSVDPVRQVAGELDLPKELPSLDLPPLPTPPPSNTSATAVALPEEPSAPADLPPPLLVEAPAVPAAAEPAKAPEPIFLTSTNSAEPAPAPAPVPPPAEDLAVLDAPPVVPPVTAPEALPLPEPPPLQAPAAEAAPLAAPPVIEPPALPAEELVARPTAPAAITEREAPGPRPQANPSPPRFVNDGPQANPPLPVAEAEAEADEIALPPLPSAAMAARPIPPSGSIAVVPGSPSEAGLGSDSNREVEEIARLQDEALRRNPPANPLAASSSYGSSAGSGDDPASASRLQLPRAPSPTEARPIRVIPVPDDFVPLAAREWQPNRKYWAAASTCHTPLYFQDAVLERYGQGVEQAMGPVGRFFSFPLDDPRQSNQRNQLLQPLISSGMFLSQIALLPYNMLMDPPWEAQYDLGFYRPGDRVPPDTYYLPKTGIGPPLHGRRY